MSGASRLWDGALGILVGYGYRLGRTLWWLLLLLAIGVAIASIGSQAALIVDADGRTTELCPTGGPCFNPLGYAIDTAVPIVNVGQADNWTLQATGALGWALEVGRIVVIFGGWLVTTAAVAGLSRSWQRK